ncbi:MAG: porin [Pseudomonadota bacterium]
MKKTLLATAIAASIAAPAVVSAAGPTIYGQAHYSVEYLKNDNESSIGVSSNTSRLGFKGAFDLGEGLQAIYLMEWGVGLDGKDDGVWKQRNRYGGFKSDTWGTIVFGRHDTPVKVIGRKVDLFWSTQLGQNRSVTNLKDGGAGYDLRADNIIGYISPSFGPVHIFAVYVTDSGIEEDPNFPITDNNDFDAYSIAAIYDQKNLFGADDNLFLAVGYEQHNINQAAVAGATEDSETALRVTGKYGFGNWKVVGLYQMADDSGFASGNDRDVFGGGLSYKMGANTLKGAIYVADDLGDTNDSGGLLYSVGVDHAMSKNVQVYAQFAALDNDDNATLKLGGSGHGDSVAGVAGETSWGVSFGSRIKF